MTHFKDLRSYLCALNDIGDLERITREVDGDLEPGAITRRSYETDAPAPLMENIRGNALGCRILGAPAGRSYVKTRPYARVALSLGLPATATIPEIIDTLIQTRALPGKKPVLVDADNAPCRQNILRGDDATLDSFAIPFAHDSDGGRYANTWGTLIVKSPDGQWINWSIARVMKIDCKRMTGLIVPSQHIGQIWQQWVELGQPMPYAMVQGTAPAIACASGIPLPAGVDEADYVGALWGEPIEVVKALSVDLEVPAQAEVVVEGHVSITRDAEEGPYGEYSGYLGTKSSPQPTFSVEVISHRDQPIWPLVVAGRPTDESHTLWAMGMTAEAISLMREAGLPITAAWIPEESAVHWLVVSVPNNWRELLPDTSSEELAQRIGEIVFRANSLIFIPRIYLVDDDIDPTCLKDVVWAIATRVHPERRRIVFSEERVIPLLHCYDADEYAAGKGAKIVYDTLQPPIGEGRLPHASFEQGYPAALRQQVIDHWPNATDQ
ncbi:UbiD family decarboxylase [Carnimonas nigrificans]|uniref:UbiD family decarboxylase n=1 Tax=Carnimonas nigrificans TaxID=64323 RepID=UPI0004723A77|nr:UbiD family decarboxylase [Carnimonas nigrificans]